MFVCVCVCRGVVFFVVTMVNFGDDCSIILTSYAPGIDVNEVLYHGKWMVRFETKRKGLFCYFWHITMILQ
jgi:hypothetical protein